MKACPNTENGYTPIANELLEQVYKLPLNGTQFRIVLVVFRYTYGFSRKEHELSESFIAKACGIHKKQIQRELSELIASKVIEIVKEATFNSSRTLKFNKYYDKWVVAKKIPPHKKDTHTGSELVTQDKQYIKSNIVVDVGEVFQFYQNNIGMINPYQQQTISTYLDDGLAPELIIEAMKDSIGADNVWRYLNRILNNCTTQKVTTIEQYNAKKVERQNKTSLKQPQIDKVKQKEEEERRIQEQVLKELREEREEVIM